MMPDGNGNFYLYLHGSVRKASGTKVGDRVRLGAVEFDAAYRNGPQHPMPKWFKQELDGNPQAKKNWAALIPSRKKEVLRYFSRLVSEDARIRNLAQLCTFFRDRTADSWGASGKTDRRTLTGINVTTRPIAAGFCRT